MLLLLRGINCIMSKNFTKLSSRQMKTHKRLEDDLPWYARHMLKVRAKNGDIVPFNFTDIQFYIHQQLEKQKAETGMVRAYLIKARQIRGSTYVQGRFFHRSCYKPCKTFILTHRDDATSNIMNMSKTFLDNMDTPVKPAMLSESGSKLGFTNGSEYALGTAASPDVGRSMTVQQFHGSEVAFWQYSDEIQTGVMQTIADEPGTEIIFESTANGPRGMFHQGIMDVLSKKDKDYIVIFIPWFWERGYTKRIPADVTFIPDEDERHLKEIHNLTDEQLYWRRCKIIHMKALWKFKQEYPANVVEAFQSSEEALINSDDVEIARKCILTDASAPVVMGIDPASSGDRHPFVIRQGRHLKAVYDHEPMDGIQGAFLATEYIKKHNVQHVFIDTTKDLSLYDQLRALGYKDMVTSVHFNQKPMNPDRFVNKRAEIVYAVKEWIEDSGINIPDDDSLHAELMCMPHEEITSNGKIFFIPKKRIKKDYGMSPDIYDAIALTFTYPVRRRTPGEGSQRFKKAAVGSRSGQSPLRNMNRRRSSMGNGSGKRNKHGTIKFRSK